MEPQEVCVKICAKGGQFTVELENEAEEQGEQEATEPTLPAMTTSLDGQNEGAEQEQVFPSVDEALQAAKTLLMGAAAQSPEDAKNSMMAGYNKAGNIGMRGRNG
ncbi:MAG: hypothetical protein WC208_13495 [Gallionella sp.]|jgi:hypothetical protein